MQNKKADTIDYYNEHAYQFAKSTENADMSGNRNRFLKWVPKTGTILDWGCGSGRDTVAFQESGYIVEAVDGAIELCKLACNKTGMPVKNMAFSELSEMEKYDGIWACASLLHIKKKDLSQIMKRAEKALKKDGVMYVSFKYGDFEGNRNGRYFTDMTEESFSNIISDLENCELIEQWVTADVREGREDEKWLNVILQKK